MCSDQGQKPWVNCVESFAHAPMIGRIWNIFVSMWQLVFLVLACIILVFAAIPWSSSLVLTTNSPNAEMCPRKENMGGTPVHVSVMILSCASCLHLFVFFHFCHFQTKFVFLMLFISLSHPFGSPCFHLNPCFRIGVEPFLLFRLCFWKDGVD